MYYVPSFLLSFGVRKHIVFPMFLPSFFDLLSFGDEKTYRFSRFFLLSFGMGRPFFFPVFLLTSFFLLSFGMKKKPYCFPVFLLSSSSFLLSLGMRKHHFPYILSPLSSFDSRVTVVLFQLSSSADGPKVWQACTTVQYTQRLSFFFLSSRKPTLRFHWVKRRALVLTKLLRSVHWKIVKWWEAFLCSFLDDGISSGYNCRGRYVDTWHEGQYNMGYDMGFYGKVSGVILIRGFEDMEYNIRGYEALGSSRS